MLALSLIVNTGTFNNAKLVIFYDIKKRRVVRALVSASVKSGKSVDNKKRVLSLAEQILQFVLSTDFTDFTDFAVRVLGYGLAALLGHRYLLDGLDSLNGPDGRERIARKRACGERIRANGLWACCPFRASTFVGWVGLVGRVGREKTYRSQAGVRRTDSR